MERVKIEVTVLTIELIDGYLALVGERLSKNSLPVYRKALRTFFEQLPSDKMLCDGCLYDFREQIMEQGYRDATVNGWVAIINGFFEHIKRRDLQFVEKTRRSEYVRPALTRNEYLRLLSTAKQLDDRMGYLLVKLFASVSLPAEAVAAVTVEAVADGVIAFEYKDRVQFGHLPEQLREDLLSYADDMGYKSGYIFRTQTGRLVTRERIHQILQRLCSEAKVDSTKGNVSCLKRLHQATCDDFRAQINPDAIVLQMQERLIGSEERLVGWE